MNEREIQTIEQLLVEIELDIKYFTGKQFDQEAIDWLLYRKESLYKILYMLRKYYA